MKIERALIVQPCWLSKILSGNKTWEMRSSKTSIRGRVGLIEAGTGLIVGECEIVDALDALPVDEYFDHCEKHMIEPDPYIPSRWKYPWVIKNAIRYDNPIKYNHPKGAVIWVKL